MPVMSDSLRKTSVMQLVYSLQVGGSEKLACDISTHLDRGLFTPFVCALDVDGDLARDLTRENIEHHVFRRKGVAPEVFRELYRYIKTRRIDIVHTHHFTQLWFAALPARLAGARIIHTEHEFFSYGESLFSRAMIKPLSGLCHRVTAVGPEVAEYFVRTIGMPREHVSVIPNGVDLTKFNYDPKPVREELGLSKDHLVIGTVGRLEPEKDQKTLLEAFRYVKEKQSAARLVIVGNGRMADELKVHAKRLGVAGHTLFLGTRRDVPRVLSAMDLFALPSVREGLPISLIEAMAAGKPVVASDIGSVRDLIRHEDNGLLVEPGDAVTLSNSLLRLLDSSSLREGMGNRGRRLAERSYGLPAMIRAYEGLYRSASGMGHVRD